MSSKDNMLQRMSFRNVMMMFVGIFLIGVCVAAYRLSLFGADPFSCMNLGISGFVGMSFGNWQLLLNSVLLIVVFFTVRHNIGLGTIVNMVCVGYIADFFCWLILEVLRINVNLPLRIFLLLMGTIVLSLGCALYMAADLGYAPYDNVPFIIMKFTKEKVSFRAAKVSSDVTAMGLGVVFCLLAGNNLWEVVGIGTAVNAICAGPLIQFFSTAIAKKLAV